MWNFYNSAGQALKKITNTPITRTEPGGRLCLTSATPVHTSDAADQTTLYYAFHKHDQVPLYDGSTWGMETFTQLSIAMAAHANWAANSNFDVFIFKDSGTIRLVTGAAWTNATTRNEAIARKNGLWTNSGAITGRYGAASTIAVPANEGLYVGTIRTTGSTGTTTMEFGGTASGGNPILFYVWNMYNRVSTAGRCLDADDSWDYTTTTWRNKNASASNRASYVVGLSEDAVICTNHIRGLFTADTPPAGGSGRFSAGPDTAGASSPTHVAQFDVIHVDSQDTSNATALYRGYPGLGYHYFQAQEWGAGTGDLSWYGDNVGTIHSDLQFEVWA